MGPVEIYDRLYAAYGPQSWWPGDSPLEITVGAVLTQNTAWGNVALAIANLKAAALEDVSALLGAPEVIVRRAIRPAGFQNVKYGRLIRLMGALDDWGGLEALYTLPLTLVRERLLSVNGVGPETADCILLYALEMPVFVVDRYTRRLLERLGEDWATSAPYDAVQTWFTDCLGASVPLYNEYHALIVVHGKAHCRAKPACDGCPLLHHCPWPEKAGPAT